MNTISKLLVAIAMIVSGLAFAAPAANAAGSKIEVAATATSQATSKVDLVVRATVDGATQVTWENSNHKVRVTKRQIRKAPKIKIRAPGANSSKRIYKKAHGARIVVLKKGSKVRNTGRLNRLRVGFVWTLKYDAVLVLKGKSRQYRHAFDIIDGKLVKNCYNYIGGKVPMKKKVVQIRYAGDIEEDVTISANANANASASGSLVCQAGTLTGSASASANASASATIRIKVRLKAAAVNAKRVELEAKVKADAEAYAKADASAKVKLECGDVVTPPPPVVPAPDVVEVDTINDVLVNNTRTITVTGTVAPGRSATLFASAKNGGSVTVNKTQSVRGNFTVKVTYKAPSEVPGPNGDVAAGRDRVDFTLTQDDGQKDNLSTNQFEIRPAPVDPL